MPGKGIDAQGILLGTGLSSYLYLIWLLQQWDKADDLFPNLPRGAVASFSDKTLPYPSLRLSVVYSMYCFPSKCFASQCYVPPQCAVSGTAGCSELPRSWEGHGAVSGRGLVARELSPARYRNPGWRAVCGPSWTSPRPWRELVVGKHPGGKSKIKLFVLLM